MFLVGAAPAEACPMCHAVAAVQSRTVRGAARAGISAVLMAILLYTLLSGHARGLCMTLWSFGLTSFLGFRAAVEGPARCEACGAERSWRGRWRSARR
jgi:hypothetical protein